MSGLTVEVVDPRADREPAGWAAFTRREELLAPWDFGLMRLESLAARHPTLLVLVRDGVEPVAALAVLHCRSWLGVGWAEVHHPWLAGSPGWAFTGRLDDAERRKVLRAFERAICRTGGLGCVGVLYKHVPREQQQLLTGRGRLTRGTVGSTVMSNRFATEEDWLAALPRTRRQSLRQQRRQIEADDDLVVRFAPARDDLDVVEMATLLLSHRARFGRLRFDQRSPMSADYLRALTVRPDVLTLTYHDRSARLLAFSTLLDHPVMPFAQLWAALPVEAGGRRGLYFDTYRRAVRHMIEHDRPALSAGRGSVQLKATLGFVEQPRLVAAVPRMVAG